MRPLRLRAHNLCHGVAVLMSASPIPPVPSSGCERRDVRSLGGDVDLNTDTPGRDHAADASAKAVTSADPMRSDCGIESCDSGRVHASSPVSRELGLAIAAAHVGWARRYAPHLLEEWLDD